MDGSRSEQALADQDLVSRLRTGDEDAFVAVVERYHTQLVRLASAFVSGSGSAEDVAQETWLARITGIDRFESRSSLRTWLFQICVNRARSVGEREHRSVPVDHVEASVDAEQFTPTGAWTSPPAPWPDWSGDPSDDADLVATIRMAITRLPGMQRLVVTMRDLDGLTSGEVCQVLSISEANQRVLLHRGRGNVRASIQRAVTGR